MALWARTCAAGRATRTALHRAVRAIRRATHAHGAGRSGLGNLIELTAVNSTGDALVALSLAGTLFFGLDVNQARGQVALYLLVTMAPFALIAPLIGPVLDHMRAARRFTIAGTMLGRGLLCWGMAGAVSHGDTLTLLPSAFVVLVLSKAYGVLRSAVTPRVLPNRITLVTANARTSFAGLIAASVAAPAAAGLVVLVGPGWVLRIATAVFIAGAVLGARLPRHVDDPETDPAPSADAKSSTHPEPSTDSAASAGEPGTDERRASERGTDERGRWRTLLRVGPVVGEAMRANAALRAFSGFLVLYLAFLLREEEVGAGGVIGSATVSPNVALGLLVAAAGAGGLVGTASGALAKARAPQLIVFGTLAITTAVTAVCAIFFGLWATLVVAFVAGFGQSLGKLSLDAIVQREIGAEIRSSTFAVSETLHQLVWVMGGALGLAMSLVAEGRMALFIVAVALGGSLGVLLYLRVRRIRHAHMARRAPASAGRARR